VDHIIPWILLKADESVANHFDNLASLCISCHGKKTLSVEPKLFKGDVLTLRRFYGEEIANKAIANWQRLEVD
jgi:5-methylcytosine-specific restriction endonuclease McrA